MERKQLYQAASNACEWASASSSQQRPIPASTTPRVKDSAAGHDFGDALSDAEVDALLAYLKTL